MTAQPPSPIRGLGEIALRVENLDVMQQFYENVVGLQLLCRFDDSAFFRIAEGYGGHLQVLALFDRSSDPNYQGLHAAHSTVDHLAFEIDLDDYAAEKQRLKNLGMKIRTAEHDWVHWRSLYVYDPEGNNVEWVCYDRSV